MQMQSPNFEAKKVPRESIVNYVQSLLEAFICSLTILYLLTGQSSIRRLIIVIKSLQNLVAFVRYFFHLVCNQFFAQGLLS